MQISKYICLPVCVRRRRPAIPESWYKTLGKDWTKGVAGNVVTTIKKISKTILHFGHRTSIAS